MLDQMASPMFQPQVIWGEILKPRPLDSSHCSKGSSQRRLQAVMKWEQKHRGARSLEGPQQQGAELALLKLWPPPCPGTHLGGVSAQDLRGALP